MKKLIFNLSLAFAILFSILFQSFHGYEHLTKQLSQKECHHKYNSSKTEITHQHHNFDHCYVCGFTLGSSISPENFVYQLYSSHKGNPCFLTAEVEVTSFSGSLYFLRGPPTRIV